MTQVSRQKVDPKVLEKVFDLFLDSIIGAGNKRQTKEFLDDLLTPTEKIMLAKRIAVAYLILQGVDHRSIASFLKVSTSTVARISLLLKVKGEGFKKVLNRLLRKKKIIDTLDSVVEILFNSLPPVSYHRRKDWRREKRLRSLEKSSLL